MGFPKGVSLDFSKLVVSGHSFGGITALASAARDTRIKAILTMDPWYYPYTDRMEKLKIQKPIPILINLSESFVKQCALYSYDYEVDLEKFHKLNDAKQLKIKCTDHLF